MFLQQRILGEMGLQQTIHIQADVQVDFEKPSKRAPFVCQAKCVIGRWARNDTNLLEVE